MTGTDTIAASEELRQRPGLLKRLWTFARRQPLGFLGGVVVVVFILMAIFANHITPYDPEASSYEHMLAPPSSQFLLGTDDFGRDVLTRIIYGARTALLVGFSCAFIGATIGLVLGVGSAFLVVRLILFFNASWTCLWPFP